MAWLGKKVPIGVTKKILQAPSGLFSKYQIYPWYVRHVACASKWSSEEVRTTFIDFYKERNHKHVPSSTVIPKKGEGSYFINAGMNQFKPIFLGTVDPSSELASYERVANSQKCIRISGKHNDLNEVGKDTFHHTFFEMLGSWSFGNYYKKEACEMAWELLTKMYKLPPEKLYVTYFAGNKSLGLEADEECKEIWKEIGVTPDKILPFGSKDNFWDMGDSGPCGPCTEIHFNHTDAPNVAQLVNSGDPRVIELWNLVFIQFDRQIKNVLLPLRAKHVDTGMGLERLVAVLQGKQSNYDTDLFQPLFNHIQNKSKCRPYGENAMVDIAYRIVADHARMASVAIGDGLLPGRGDRDSRLRMVINRAVRQCNSVLKAKPGFFGSLVPIVADSLGGAYPELKGKSNEIENIIQQTEERYLYSLEMGHKTMKKAWSKYRHVKQLNAEQMQEIYSGRFGRTLSIDLIEEIAGEMNIGLDLDSFHQLIKAEKVEDDVEAPDFKKLLDQNLLQQLTEMNVKPTDDTFKYKYTSILGHYFLEAPPGVVKAILHNGKLVDSVGPNEECGIILSKTMFYAESGGQAGDKGWLASFEGCDIIITDVQRVQDYVIHIGTIEGGILQMDDTVQMAIDQNHREKCMKNHTGTHILNYGLGQVLGKIRQAGSSVTAEKLSFEFTSAKPKVTSDDLKKVAALCKKLVMEKVPVIKGEVPLSDARQVKGLVMLPDAVYPKKVRVISIGADLEEIITYPNSGLAEEFPVELCGGTHVDNTGDLVSLVITNFHGTTQGTRSVTAVTGNAAIQAEIMAQNLKEQVEELENWVKVGYNKEQWTIRCEGIQKSLSGDNHILPKIDRDSIKTRLDKLMYETINKEKNKSKKESMEEDLRRIIDLESQEYVITQFQFEKIRDIVSVVSRLQPMKPVMLLSHSKQTRDLLLGLCYFPKKFRNGLSANSWAHHVTSSSEGKTGLPGKTNELDLATFTIKLQDKQQIDHVTELARTYM